MIRPALAIAIAAALTAALTANPAAATTSVAAGAGSQSAPAVNSPVNLAVNPRPIKVVIISMFGPEAEPWVVPFALTQTIPVPGLSPDYPAIRCNTDDVCLMTTGMGHANAAASTLALTLDARFDFRKTYFITAGIAGMDPQRGTLGAATWARWLVDVGIAHEIDAREMPKNWKFGYYGLLAKGPGIKPKLEYRTEVAKLDEALLQKVLALTKGAVLTDSKQAQAYRAKYREPAARALPTVMQCDTLGGDTWWHGHRLGQHARDWTKLMTDGQGQYCTTQQEDNATYNALERAAAAGKADLKRYAVLRTASNFDRPYPGQSAAASLLASTGHDPVSQTGGFGPATQNLAIVGGLVVRDIVKNWPQWQAGVPAP